jgi:triosephosphate isomerase
MRERIVIGNWKMNPPTIADAVELARNVADRMPGGVLVGVAPAAVALPAVSDALRDANVDVYAQDVHWEERGAFTGQISVSMIRGLAVATSVTLTRTSRRSSRARSKAGCVLCCASEKAQRSMRRAPRAPSSRAR